MYTTYYINLSIKTADGPKQFGYFNLGADREDAYGLFKKLKGSPAVDHNDLLYIEFMETINGLPINIDILSCDLQELGNNCMLITQEVFRLSNIKDK
jgi:hypothetical protein